MRADADAGYQAQTTKKKKDVSTNHKLNLATGKTTATSQPKACLQTTHL
jgi:hypothetical protein